MIMEQTVCMGLKKGLRDHESMRAFKKWAALAASIFVLWLFLFVIGPFFLKTPAIAPLADFIEERGIDAGALYYTDIEEFSEAEINMKNTMFYTPEGGGIED